MTAEDKRLPRILCMDDHKEACEEVVSVLSKLPARVDVAYDGNAAMDCLLDRGAQSDPYDLLILDMCAPVDLGKEVDGRLALKLLTELARDYQLLRPGTPIIIYTQYPSYPNCVECISAGATDYIDKAGDPDTGEPGIRILFGRCRDILYPERQPDRLRQWLDEHLIDLIREQGGWIVALVDHDVAKEARIVGTEMGGYVLISGTTYQEVRDQIMRNRILRWRQPRIINVPRPQVRVP